MKNKKLKIPKMPAEPLKPYKPIEPSRKISENKSLGHCTVGKDFSYTLASFMQLLRESCIDYDQLNPEDICFDFNVESESTYYDDHIHTIEIAIYSNKEIDNPHYEEYKKLYDKQKVKYDKDLENYEKNLKQYKKDHKKYQQELDKYNLEHSKLQVERLEKKLKVNAKT